MKKPIAYARAGNLFRACGGSQREPAVQSVCVDRAENLVEVPPVEVIKVGDGTPRSRRIALKYPDNPGRIAVGQWFDQRCIHKAKDGDVGADAQRQYQDGRAGEAWALAQLAQRVTDVLEESRHTVSSFYS